MGMLKRGLLVRTSNNMGAWENHFSDYTNRDNIRLYSCSWLDCEHTRTSYGLVRSFWRGGYSACSW